MGNCQAVDAAALVIQHPSGKIERMYWSVNASEIMNMNPGHYVSLIIPLTNDGEEENSEEDKTVRFTRVKLLRPTDKLVLGRAYRLVGSQEVMKVLRAKKYAKMNKNLPEAMEMLETDREDQSSRCNEAKARGTELERSTQPIRHERLRQRQGSASFSAARSKSERQRQRPGSASFAAARSKSWRPSLQSISEAAS